MLEKQIKDLMVKRGVDPMWIKYFEENNINAADICQKKPEGLENFLEKETDRIAVYLLAKALMKKESEENEVNKVKKRGNKRKRTGPQAKSPAEEVLEPEKEKLKTHEVSIGWLHRDDPSQEYDSVKEKISGGRRTVKLLSNEKFQSVLDSATLLFKKGICKMGRMEDFTFQLINKQHDEIGLDVTIGLYVKEEGLRKDFTVFMATQKKPEKILKDVTIQWWNKTCDFRNRDVGYEMEDTQVVKMSENYADLWDTCEGTFFPNGKSILGPRKNFSIIGIEDEQLDSQGVVIFRTLESPDFEAENLEDHNYVKVKKDIGVNTDSNFGDAAESSSASASSINSGNTFAFHQDASRLESHRETESVGDVPFVSGVIDDVEIEIDRSRAYEALLLAFKSDSDIVNKRLSVKIVGDRGVGKGPYKEIVSEFFDSFYVSQCIGNNAKIPVINSDDNDLKAFGAVVLKSYKDLGIFPFKLAKSFMMAAMGLVPSADDLVKDFLSFLDAKEENTILKFLADISMPNTEAVEILGRFGLRNSLTERNAKEVIGNLAKTHFLKKNKYVIDLLSESLKNMMTKEKLLNLYTKCEPTPENIVNAIYGADDTPVSFYAQQFVINNPLFCSKFIRLVTGFDYLTEGGIKVEFNTDESPCAPISVFSCFNKIIIPARFACPDGFKLFEEQLKIELTSKEANKINVF